MQHSTQDVTNLTRQLKYFAQLWIGTKTTHRAVGVSMAMLVSS